MRILLNFSCYRAVVLYNSLTTAREQVVSLHISDPAAMVVCHSLMYLSVQIHTLPRSPSAKPKKNKKTSKECLSGYTYFSLVLSYGLRLLKSLAAIFQIRRL